MKEIDNSIRVIAYWEDGEYIGEFSSSMEANRKLFGWRNTIGGNPIRDRLKKNGKPRTMLSRTHNKRFYLKSVGFLSREYYS
jgi:hypothetical protein